MKHLQLYEYFKRNKVYRAGAYVYLNDNYISRYAKVIEWNGSRKLPRYDVESVLTNNVVRMIVGQVDIERELYKNEIEKLELRFAEIKYNL